MKKLIKHYRESIRLIHDLDQQGLVSVEMPPINFFVSPKLDASRAIEVLEAMRVYAAIYSLMQKLVTATQSVSIAMALYIAFRLLGS